MTYKSIDPGAAKSAADTIRMLAADAVEQAKSGHPGMPMGAADMAFVLWTRFLRFDPTDPTWDGRDRFILSAGHGSMLQYALLHLFGFGLSMDEIKNFRQLDSKTPGHPEYGHTPGVELTTGPLGQGFADGVGMALAAKLMMEKYGSDRFCPTGERVFAIVGDGDLMEGISYEAASFAGHLKLGNLVYLYDSNDITIEGKTDLTCSEDVQKRFEAAGWDVHVVSDGHDHEAIAKGIQSGIDCTDKPSLIVCRTHIAFGSPGKQDSSSSHGAPLGKEELAATKKALGWPPSPSFLVPDEISDLFAGLSNSKTEERKKWDADFESWKESSGDSFSSFEKAMADEIPGDILTKMIQALPDKDDASRNYSGVVLQAAATELPTLTGGSADLAPSNKTMLKDAAVISAGSFGGRNIHFGIREHAMGAIANGMSLFGGIRPYVGTFLVFADYMRPAIRMAALMKLPVIFVFTHDSFWVGEDGPTHQPIEHVSSLRLIPNLQVFRPSDGAETAVAWEMALRRKDGPCAIIASRQKLARYEHAKGFTPDLAKMGAYIAAESDDENCLNVIIASGSEVSTCVAAKEMLKAEGVDVRVVSMLCHELFEAQSDQYKQAVIRPDAQNVFWVEAGYEPLGFKYVKGKGSMIEMSDFGKSAPGKVLAELFGFTPEKIAHKVGAGLLGE